jgi:predicted transcriptional regulator
MSSEQEPNEVKPVKLTDAKGMRAMAHPVRMALLELFSVRETLTATQASEALGESPANCAFHLRTLAKYGFVHEAGGGKGRERPWALTNRSITVETEQDDPQAALAAEELVKVYFERWADRARRYGLSAKVPGWDSRATGWTGHVSYLTAEETIQLRDEMRRLLNRYEERLNPELRPEGALPVEWMLFAAPIPEWADAAGPDPATGPGALDAAASDNPDDTGGE